MRHLFHRFFRVAPACSHLLQFLPSVLGAGRLAVLLTRCCTYYRERFGYYIKRILRRTTKTTGGGAPLAPSTRALSAFIAIVYVLYVVLAACTYSSTSASEQRTRNKEKNRETWALGRPSRKIGPPARHPLRSTRSLVEPRPWESSSSRVRDML